MAMKKVIAVAGPTASGKTRLSIELAKLFNGEIVCCDSMQVYRGMDIGTAKPTPAERAQITHHMYDVVDPSIPFSCADYAEMADKCISEIISRGMLPIVCGGSGLYMNTLLCGISDVPDIPESIRENLSKKSPEELYIELLQKDPEAAQSIHPNNVKRVMRALEIHYGTGITKTEWDRKSKYKPKKYDSLIIGIAYRNREILYNRINSRVDEMLSLGLADEVKSLDLDRSSNAAQGIGYKELYEWIDGKCTYNEAVEKLKQNTRNYAKRQMTWFGKSGDVKWIYPDDYPDYKDDDKSFKNIVNIASEIVKSNGFVL